MRVLVPASLLVSFAANDGEELATMSATMAGTSATKSEVRYSPLASSTIFWASGSSACSLRNSSASP